MVGIEGLLGSAFADTLGGDGGANQLDGGDGNDGIDGRGGADILRGGAGDDTLVGGAGADTLDGGDGLRDMVSYWTSATGVRAVLVAAGSNTSDAAGDVYLGIEDLGGSAFNDVLGGDAVRTGFLAATAAMPWTAWVVPIRWTAAAATTR